MIEIQETSHIFGKIVKYHKNEFLIELEDDIVFAKKAFSCLIEPAINDIVAILNINDTNYITHILERTEIKSIDISIECNSFNVTANELKLTTANSNILCTNFNIESHYIDLQSQTYQNSATVCNNNFIQDTTKTTQSFKYVSGHNEVQSDSSRILTQEMYVIKAKNLIATAEDQVKIDGQNICLA